MELLIRCRPCMHPHDVSFKFSPPASMTLPANGKVCAPSAKGAVCRPSSTPLPPGHARDARTLPHTRSPQPTIGGDIPSCWVQCEYSSQTEQRTWDLWQLGKSHPLCTTQMKTLDPGRGEALSISFCGFHKHDEQMIMRFSDGG